MNLPIWMRIVAGVALVLFIVWRVRDRWQAASEASEAMGLEQQAMRAMHTQLLQHPAWHRLWQLLAARGYLVSVTGPQAGAFHFGLLTLGTYSGHAVDMNDPGIIAMNAYLQGPKKIVASLVFATGQVQIRDVAFGEWPWGAL
ncbi:MAG: hypothetical protein HOW73_05015 [Polyangiaceae bacterium]|nr:hypothetical protein [Polyangiaceae bacterium]